MRLLRVKDRVLTFLRDEGLLFPSHSVRLLVTMLALYEDGAGRVAGEV